MADVADTTMAQMTLVDWLDDLTVRFLLNLPPAELSSIPRLCFQVEEAQWYYEDFIRPANPSLPSLNLRQFLLTLFQHCPLLSGFDATQHVAAYEEFLSYKVRVPVRGAILMDDSMDKVLLVRGWKKGASWSFPRGKINKDEKDLDCAIREVYEETGYDIAAAGLVEPNKGQDGLVKAIDITMREQHMKLFVFRGVPLDTYFEPRTRKEISKISWYNVKDLPGFKKQKGLAGQGQGEAATSKFYMVAPFLGPLKKWIGQQRRDAHNVTKARHSQVLPAGIESQAAVTEDEVDTEQEFATDNELARHDHSADELKRLLSIGNPTLAPIAQGPHTQPFSQAHTLLAMLKGSQATIPQTPMEQIDPVFPTQPPETPQPHHPRHSSFSVQQQQQAVPRFPYSSNRMQQQQQFQNQQSHASFHSSNAFEAGLHTQNGASPFHGLAPQPQHYPQQQGRHPNVPTFPFEQAAQQQQVHNDHLTESSRNLHQQVQAAHERNPQTWQSFAGPTQPLASPMPPTMHSESQTSPFWQTAQQGQKPLGAEPSVPEPSKLPAPKLSEHSMKLLDVFRGAGAGNANANDAAKQSVAQRSNSQQAALLSLFRKPTITTAPPVVLQAAATAATPSSPTLSDITVKPGPPASIRRTSTINEITRTLPTKPKVKRVASPIAHAHQSPSPQSLPFVDGLNTATAKSTEQRSTHPVRGAQIALSDGTFSDRPNSRGQLSQTSVSQKTARAPSRSDKLETDLVRPSNAQRPTSRHGPRSPKANVNAKQRTVPNDATSVVPQFSILQRPGSSAGRVTPLASPQSALRQESTQIGSQPQLLKRTGSAGHDEIKGAPLPASRSNDTKKDHLLSLFGKSGNVTASPAANRAISSAEKATPPQAVKPQSNALLQLFDSTAAPETSAKTPDPPPAPRLSPELKAASQFQKASQSSSTFGQTSQQALLSLFHKPATGSTSTPGTPISPFTLNPPVATTLPSSKLSVQVNEPRTRLNSIPSVKSHGGSSGPQTPKSATPTAEAKGFLLDYLNGVVQKEAYRGTKKQ